MFENGKIQGEIRNVSYTPSNGLLRFLRLKGREVRFQSESGVYNILKLQDDGTPRRNAFHPSSGIFDLLYIPTKKWGSKR